MDSIVDLTHEELFRYSRHIMLPGFGKEGQLLLKKSKVVIIGAGGTGSAAAMYLAAAGIGDLGIIDFDTVDLSNLQRQVIHSEDSLGMKKTTSAVQHVKKLNNGINVTGYDLKLSSSNALDILAGWDVIIDCTDNFPANYLINDAALILGKPVVYGSVYRFESKVTVFAAAGAPCLRCLFPVPPQQGEILNCNEGGVLNILTGITGNLQALEAIKILHGRESLIGTVLHYDAETTEFNKIRLDKDPGCICGTRDKIKLIDYELFCGVNKNLVVSSVPEISAHELKNKLDTGQKLFLLDVRNQSEYDIVNIGGCLIPLNELKKRLDEIDGSNEIAIICKTGRRSKIAAGLLMENGFQRVMSLKGGIKAWIESIDKNLPYY